MAFDRVPPSLEKMSETNRPKSETAIVGANKNVDGSGQVDEAVLRKFGGRLLIFRTTPSSFRLWPRPYVMISSFRGPVWMFYGAGQVWITHKKFREFSGWMARVSRFRNKAVLDIANQMTSDLESFVDYCNEHGIEGTLLIEAKVIEFHWTFGFDLEKENQKNEHAADVEAQFRKLSQHFVAVKQELGIACKAS